MENNNNNMMINEKSITDIMKKYDIPRDPAIKLINIIDEYDKYIIDRYFYVYRNINKEHFLEEKEELITNVVNRYKGIKTEKVFQQFF